jgi:hypothetical protein
MTCPHDLPPPDPHTGKYDFGLRSRPHARVEDGSIPVDPLSTVPVIDHRRNPDIDRQKRPIKSAVRSPSDGQRGSRDHEPASRGFPQQPERPQRQHDARHPQNSKICGKVPVCHPSHPSANAHTDRELPLGLYSCAEKRISPLTCKLGKAISIRVEDIGRRRLLTRPRPGRQLPVGSALRVSEG